MRGSCRVCIIETRVGACPRRCEARTVADQDAGCMHLDSHVPVILARRRMSASSRYTRRRVTVRPCPRDRVLASRSSALDHQTVINVRSSSCSELRLTTLAPSAIVWVPSTVALAVRLAVPGWQFRAVQPALGPRISFGLCLTTCQALRSAIRRPELPRSILPAHAWRVRSFVSRSPDPCRCAAFRGGGLQGGRGARKHNAKQRIRAAARSAQRAGGECKSRPLLLLLPEVLTPGLKWPVGHACSTPTSRDAISMTGASASLDQNCHPASSALVIPRRSGSRARIPIPAPVQASKPSVGGMLTALDVSPRLAPTLVASSRVASRMTGYTKIHGPRLRHHFACGLD